MRPDYSIIIPAFNEAPWLPITLTSLHKAMASLAQIGEVIVVDNNSSDNTAEIAHLQNAKVVHEPINQISRARNTGARAAQGKYLFFVDADTVISPALLKNALERLVSGASSGGGAVVEFDAPLDPLARLGLRFWTWISVKFGLAAGCFVYCLQDDFISVGGFSEAVYASEEIWLSLALKRVAKKQGKTFDIISDYPAVSSARKLHWFTIGEQLLLLFMFLLFPFLVRFRGLCRFWYYRPRNAKNNHSLSMNNNDK